MMPSAEDNYIPFTKCEISFDEIVILPRAADGRPTEGSAEEGLHPTMVTTGDGGAIAATRLATAYILRLNLDQGSQRTIL